ncbi:MAG TPA: acyclic terpene utilization AtuA family protein [Acidimicrobiales bacterium]|nr:acyclic terpene utilization AtuA family protein [Acidimicrobiales bacterium]
MRGGRAVRIANCSGFYGDRMAALAEMVDGGPIDVVTGDYLAEVTMLILARARLRQPGGGFATTFLRQLEPVVGKIAEAGIKVVVNAGGLNPAGLAVATRELLQRLDLPLAVAHVEGDDLLRRLPALLADGHDFAHLDTGEAFRTWGRQPLTANAYLGGYGITAALEAGADIVVTGRVADASLVAGAAAWWWGWDRSDLDALAGAVVAGHVIECGAQATGGNFSGFKTVADLRRPGFPLAEIERDGSSVVTKHPGSGGAVTVDTVTAQLLYEIGEPAYLNPDVVAHMDSVVLSSEGRDRVRIAGVQGTPAPATTKLAITALGGWRNSSTVVLTGLDIDAKASLFESAVRAALDGRAGIEDLRFTRIGEAAADPGDQMTGSCLLEVSVDGEEAACGRPFSALLVELALANYPGIYYTGTPSNGSPYGAYWPALVRQDALEHTVVHADGRREVVPPGPMAPRTPRAERELVVPGRPGRAGAVPETPPSPATPPPDGPTVEGPLGLLVQARSGDKGGNANVGVWVSDPRAWPWLACTLTTERLRRLLPEVGDLAVDRYELANLRAVNFVVHGLLDGGATEARRYDKQAKALGEWLRARHVALPISLLPS